MKSAALVAFLAPMRSNSCSGNIDMAGNDTRCKQSPNFPTSTAGILCCRATLAFFHGARVASPAYNTALRRFGPRKFIKQVAMSSSVGDGGGDEAAVAAAREARKAAKAEAKAAKAAKKAAGGAGASAAAKGLENEKITPRSVDYSAWYQVGSAPPARVGPPAGPGAGCNRPAGFKNETSLFIPPTCPPPPPTS